MCILKFCGPVRALFLAACLAAAPAAGRAEPEFIAMVPYYLPNIAGLGVGRLPDYIGSDDYTYGAAPGFRLSQGFRSVDLQVNFLTSNLLDHPNWRLGPAAILRFGRKDVEDPVVDRLPDINDTLQLGVAAGYDLPLSNDPRDRFRISADITHDVLGVHDGYTAALSLRRWLPAFRFSALALSAAATYGSQDYIDTFFSISPDGAAASGLPAYSANAGVRDVRTAVVFIQPLSPSIFLGAGILYSRLLGDAADSPIVATRGSRDQLVAGVGVAFTF